MKFECPSTITSVVVHGRGALVTRSVPLPEGLPADAEIAIPGVTLFAEAGSARAALEASERAVVAVRSSVVVPSTSPPPGPTLARVRELGIKVERIEGELESLRTRRGAFVEAELDPSGRRRDGKRPRDAFDVRFADALRIAELLREKTAALDERIGVLENELRAAARALEAARLEDRQTSQPSRITRPARTFTVRIAGHGSPGRLDLTYAVAAARWWPFYTLRIAKDEAAWAFEAIVAQDSGEDWSAVRLALSTADLVFDARLPDLPSLRFGRAQPRRPAYRPAPAGVDEMFASYAAFGRKTFAPSAAHAEPLPPPTWADGDGDGTDADDTPPRHEMAKKKGGPPLRSRAMTAPMSSGAMRAAPGAAPVPPAPAAPPKVGGAPVAAKMMAFAAMAPQSLGRAAAGGGGFGGIVAEETMTALADGFAPSYSEPEPELVPSDAWLDLDALVLASPDDELRRGRLVPQRGEAAGGIARAVAAIDRIAEERWVDPRVSRGTFDLRFDAEGSADVPSDGRPHRVHVGAARGPVRLAFRTVPSASPEVFREAALENPFGHALLGGPVDVYLDGTLLTTTAIDRIDRGGRFTVGMGVDERLKVARNVRAQEEATGLLGGAIAVTHTIEIELSSTIGGPADVTVLERVPVSDEKPIEVKLLDVKPPADPYDQAAEGAPIRGGLAFHVTVDPAKKSRIEVRYRITFPNKLEIVGGNRRG